MNPMSHCMYCFNAANFTFEPRHEKICQRELENRRVTKPACSATWTRWGLEILDIETGRIMLYRQLT